MNARQRRILDAFQRARAFINALPEPLTNATLKPMRAELGEIIGRLSSQAVEQQSGANHRAAGTQRLNTLLRALRRKHMQPIVDLARKHLNHETAGIDKTLIMPPVRLDPTAMLASATTMADSAEPHAPLFVEKGGLNADFIQKLREAAQDIGVVVEVRAKEKERVVGATADVRNDLRRGRHVVKLLDTLVSAELDEDPGQLREWKTAKRIIAREGGYGGGSDVCLLCHRAS